GVIAIGLVVSASLGACSSASGGSMSSDGVKVLAAENFWGSFAVQLGGDRVEVTSIIDNPNADPHDYEPTTADARSMATATFVIVNGIGYDPWADRLLAANPVRGRDVLNVGKLVGIPVGGNPHRWYSPQNVQQVIDAITTEYRKLDPKDASSFDQQRSTFETSGLADYHRLITEIRAKYAGTQVGA